MDRGPRTDGRRHAPARAGKRLSVERLEPRLLLTATGGDPFRPLLSHGGLCNCPICTGQGLTALTPQAATVSSPVAPTQPSSTPIGVPQLSSRPGAKATLYLDFNGNVESRWGDFINVVTPAYDTDGNAASFSTGELSAIREIWARVAEDYAPFNINVTTVAPPLIADRVAVRLAIGGNYSDWFGNSAGGVAYVGGFSNGASNVGYVFEDALGNGNQRYTAEAVSHEAGHLFGLLHQSDWSGGQLVTEYNAGTSQLAPIMGVGYYADRTTWTRGPTTGGPVSVQDDLSIIAGASNGFGYVADDYGSTTSTASALTFAGSSVNVSGLIGRTDDRDVFKFTTAGGALNLSLGVAAQGADLDAVLELQNAAGRLLVSANPASSLGATLATTVGAGTYYLIVRSSGGYGNLGKYTLRGSIAAPMATPTVPAPSQPQPSSTGSSSGSAPQADTVTPAAPRIIDNGAAGFTITGAWQVIGGGGNANDMHLAPAGQGEATATWTFTGLAPGQYRLAASWPGSQLNSASAPFSISSGNKVLGTVRVNQQRAASTFTDAGAKWQNLGTFTIQGNSLVVRLSNATTGRVVADAVRLERVFATSGGTAIRAGQIIAADPVSELMLVLASEAGGDSTSPIDFLPPPGSNDVLMVSPADCNDATLLLFAPASLFSAVNSNEARVGKTPLGIDAEVADMLLGDLTINWKLGHLQSAHAT